MFTIANEKPLNLVVYNSPRIELALDIENQDNKGIYSTFFFFVPFIIN
jgi:hypothetical protein